jgi:hypothetical protein
MKVNNMDYIEAVQELAKKYKSNIKPVYGEIDETALNAQDIAGPANAPAFSISKRDAVVLKADLLDVEDVDEITVTLDADTQVTKNKETFNICGVLPGKTQERIILLSAHYDSYFNGFQDDNTAIAMMLGIARALIISGYEPVNTIVFCAMASAVPLYQNPLSDVIDGVNTNNPPCFLPKSHHLDELKCSFNDHALYCVKTATF